MSRLEGRLLNEVGRAIEAYELIAEGDRILVGVSGGKDSLTLLHLLEKLRRRAPVRFELVAVNLDQGAPGFDPEPVRAYLAGLGVEHHMLREDTFSIAKRLTPPGKTYCSVCSRLRRGILYNTAVELRCNKMALGHHRDDLIETLLLSALFSGSLKSMPAKLVADDGRNTVIRPLIYSSEERIRAYALEQRLPVLPASPCAEGENLQRARVKQLIADLAKEHPAVPGNLLNALQNVVPSHLLDPSLSSTREGARFKGAAPRTAGRAPKHELASAQPATPPQAAGAEPSVEAAVGEGPKSKASTAA
ncbi:MAG TPA: tRNA 2-thiocytidine(32) synthetase TtcA [Myxococcales bacterium]|nr:tRNA 2-thiocytidine(32) synthetase TtcA [Myxococcales bacterium]